MIKRALLVLAAHLWLVLTVGLPDGRVVEYNCEPHATGQETGVYVVFEFDGIYGRFDCTRGVVFPSPWSVEVIGDD